MRLYRGNVSAGYCNKRMAENWSRIYTNIHITARQTKEELLVEGLGEGGGGSDVGIAGSLVGAGGLLQSFSVSEVSSAVGLVGGGVVGLEIDIEKEGKHLDVGLNLAQMDETSSFIASTTLEAAAAEYALAPIGSMHLASHQGLSV